MTSCCISSLLGYNRLGEGKISTVKEEIQEVTLHSTEASARKFSNGNLWTNLKFETTF